VRIHGFMYNVPVRGVAQNTGSERQDRASGFRRIATVVHAPNREVQVKILPPCIMARFYS
jgi:hypothetical protein